MSMARARKIIINEIGTNSETDNGIHSDVSDEHRQTTAQRIHYWNVETAVTSVSSATAVSIANRVSIILPLPLFVDVSCRSSLQVACVDKRNRTNGIANLLVRSREVKSLLCNVSFNGVSTHKLRASYVCATNWTTSCNAYAIETAMI